MLRSEAETLMRQIVGAWPDHPWPQGLIDQWVYDLTKLDCGAAGTAFARAKRSHSQAPTWIEYHLIYVGVRTKGTHPPEPCAACSGTGFTERKWVLLHQKHWYEIAGCCDCAAGVRRRDAAQQWGRDIDTTGGLTEDEWAKAVLVPAGGVPDGRPGCHVPRTKPAD